MMLKTILMASCIAVLMVVIGLIWHLKDKEFARVQQEHEKSYAFQDDMLNEAYYIQLKNWELQFDSLRNIAVKSSQNKTLDLYKLLRAKTVVLYFSSHMCTQCVESTLMQFSGLLKKHEVENYVIIGEGFRTDYFFKDESLANWRSNSYLAEESIFSRDHSLETPVILFMRNNGVIQTAFVTPKNLSKFHELFSKSLIGN